MNAKWSADLAIAVSVVSKFSDDDLKRLKESSLLLELDDNTVLTGKELQALLARLEAAEAYIGAHSDISHRYYEAWRKACGK